MKHEEIESKSMKIERIFLIVIAVVWVIMLLPLPFLNVPVFIGGIPLLWFWVLLWSVLISIILTIAYYMIEGR